MNFILWLLITVLPIKSTDIKAVEYPKTVIDEKVIAMIQEELLITKVLDSIAIRESRNRYDVISPTMDFGKYQLNYLAHFGTYGICRGVNPYEFLKNPTLQERKARELMKLHISIMRQYGVKITEKKLHLSWFGIAYSLYN